MLVSDSLYFISISELNSTVRRGDATQMHPIQLVTCKYIAVSRSTSSASGEDGMDDEWYLRHDLN